MRQLLEQQQQQPQQQILTSAAPNAAPAALQTAFSFPDDNSPEAAGIFRIFRANADPLPAGPAATPAAGDDTAGGMPLPPQRPGASQALSPGPKVTLAASTL